MTKEEEIKLKIEYQLYKNNSGLQMADDDEVALRLLAAIEDIKAEIKKNRDRDISGSGNIVDWLDGYRTAFNETLVIIDDYISGKEKK